MRVNELRRLHTLYRESPIGSSANKNVIHRMTCDWHQRLEAQRAFVNGHYIRFNWLSAQILTLLQRNTNNAELDSAEEQRHFIAKILDENEMVATKYKRCEAQCPRQLQHFNTARGSEDSQRLVMRKLHLRVALASQRSKTTATRPRYAGCKPEPPLRNT